jgi:hypothetical protein
VRSKFGKGRKRPGEQNKTEALFETDYLKPWLATGKIQQYGYEEVTFKLGPDVRYTPDYWALADDDVIDFYECKGSFLLDANGRTKFKVAAERFPFRFWFYKYLGKGKGWEIRSPYD